MRFEWDKRKETENLVKHGVDFEIAKEAFRDARRVVLHDEKHSQTEPRLFCIGFVDGRVLTPFHRARRGDPHHWRGILERREINL